MADKPQKERARIGKLADLAPRKFIIEIEREADVLEIPCKPLTYKRYQEIGWGVADPAPPIAGVDPVTKRPLHDTNDPSFIRARGQASDERLYRRLLEFLDIDVPGETVEEQVKALGDLLEFGIVSKLAALMTQTFIEGEARIISRADTFHGA